MEKKQSSHAKNISNLLRRPSNANKINPVGSKVYRVNENEKWVIRVNIIFLNFKLLLILFILNNLEQIYGNQILISLLLR